MQYVVVQTAASIYKSHAPAPSQNFRGNLFLHVQNFRFSLIYFEGSFNGSFVKFVSRIVNYFCRALYTTPQRGLLFFKLALSSPH